MDRIYILAIETTGVFASVALLEAEADASSDAARSASDGSRLLGVIHGNDRFSHLQNLTPQIDRLLKENGLSIGDMTAITVSHGPGSFTGIRIGVSTARALAQILHIPCIPVSSLEALALRTEDPFLEKGENAGAAPSGVLICPILDARRKQVYGAAYEIIDGRPVCRLPQASCLMTDFLQRLDGLLSGAQEEKEILFIGNGIDTCGEIIQQWQAEGNGAQVSFAEKPVRDQDASTVALRGLQLWREGKAVDYMELQPEYLRMAEAEKKLRDRQAIEAAGSGSEKTKA